MKTLGRVLVAQDGVEGLNELRALLEARAPSVDVVHFSDGEAVCGYLFDGRPAPSKNEILLIDRHLSKRDALDVFIRIRLDPSLERLPIVFIVDSRREEEFLSRAFACPVLRRPIHGRPERFFEICSELGLKFSPA